MKHVKQSVLFSLLISLGVATQAAESSKTNEVANSVTDSLNQAVVRHHLDTGVAVQVVKPFFQNNPAYYTLVANRVVVGTSGVFFFVNDVQQQVDVKNTIDAAPELWVNYTSDSGLGFRTRLWFFRQGTSQSVFAPGNPLDSTLSFPFSSAAPIGLDIDARDNNLPDFMTVGTTLKAFVWDGMVSQDFTAAKTNMSLGGGIRYVYLYQVYDATEYQEPGVTEDQRVVPPVPQTITFHQKVLSSNQVFNGGGPVVQFQVKRAFGQSGFALVGLVRNSILFGPAKQTASKILTVRGTHGTDELNENAYVRRSNSRNSVLDILETELGVEYGRDLSPLSRLYGQVTFNVQEWFGGGSASRSSTTGAGFGTPGSGTTGAPQVAGVTSESNFGFIGGSLKMGYEFS